MNEALRGLAVIVTRPAAQAEALIAGLEAAGASVLALPALRVEPLDLKPTDLERADPERFDWVVYTSTNAVAAALSRWPAPRAPRLVAIGAATAAALAGHGLSALRPPAPASNTEGVLALPGFAQPCGQRVLIARGLGGRELLRETLLQRGAVVESIELYRRVPVAWPAGTLERLRQCLRAADTTVLALSSVEGLDAVLAAAGAEGCALLATTTLLVPGARVATTARARGLVGPIIEAAAADDAAMIAALMAAPHRQ